MLADVSATLRSLKAHSSYTTASISARDYDVVILRSHLPSTFALCSVVAVQHPLSDCPLHVTCSL
ncbi:uncharacterized protein PHACADRAFT_264180 [Phanerochaete carnosa HHB-10118-sp]|uniref:Uncharacterized protein n=1 Tax=Phanerochaete carnosa (strain HHB-10118-sp) TaxID=650164 RepID=K5WKD5_PHACS|nr:uncharacterized protein PHACADRAFT_264180 [Phanerochaete carnosa HHB-10118-sp]EKM50727.1 hypothetical protein PHACADRAFT_264180 [Phanerochaete carnosa HHB-10118-sp]